ncbi:MAG: serine/threonine-protein kinase [Roseibacillus sp.]
MPEPDYSPDESTIDAWLSGNLSHAEAAGLEQYFSQNPPTQEKVPSALRAAANNEPPQDKVTHLVKLLSTIGTMPLPPVRPDAWQDILTPSETEDILGTLAHYEVLEVIASGGMGIVFRARDPELERLVAIKALSPDLASNSTARIRFLREAKAAAALEHDNILPLYSVHNDPSPWFAMRYVDGGTLQDALDSGKKLPLSRLKSIALQTASALAAAHQAGIVHRDIKPANIMLEKDSDRIWVCDFGIARSITDPSLTYAGNVAGTPLYMSPEQASGVLLDGRSDLFSLGSVLYHCATGQFPFAGETSAAVLKNVSKSEPAKPRSLNGELPTWFERLLEKLLQKDPAQRYPDAAALIETLESEKAPLSPEKRLRRTIFCTLLLTSLLIIALLQWAPARNLTNQGLLAITGHSYSIKDRLGTFNDLAAVIETAQAKDTVVLHRSEVIPIDIVTIPKNKPLTFRAAKGASPVLANTGPNAHIKSFASIRLIGLTFRPHEFSKNSPGCLHLSGETNLIRDCLFEGNSTPLNSNTPGRPSIISLGNHSSARIEDCRFHLSEVAVVSAWDRRPEQEGLTPNRIDFKRSLLTGSRSVTIIRVDSSVGLRISYQDCLVATDCVVMDYWNMKLKPLSIRSQNTIFAPQHAFLWASGESAKTAVSLIKWQSENDVYRIGAPFYSSATILPKPSKGSLVTLRAMWLRNSKGSFLGSKDLEFSFPGIKPDLRSLQEALSEEAPPEALQTLDQLSR